MYMYNVLIVIHCITTIYMYMYIVPDTISFAVSEYVVYVCNWTKGCGGSYDGESDRVRTRRSCGTHQEIRSIYIIVCEDGQGVINF